MSIRTLVAVDTMIRNSLSTPKSLPEENLSLLGFEHSCPYEVNICLSSIQHPFVDPAR